MGKQGYKYFGDLQRDKYDTKLYFLSSEIFVSFDFFFTRMS